MIFTTTTEISRKGSKIFNEYDEAIVLNNNKNIGLLLGGKLAQALLDSGVLTQIKEELWEINNKETSSLVKSFKKGEKSDFIEFNDFKRKYDL